MELREGIMADNEETRLPRVRMRTLQATFMAGSCVRVAASLLCGAGASIAARWRRVEQGGGWRVGRRMRSAGAGDPGRVHSFCKGEGQGWRRG